MSESLQGTQAIIIVSVYERARWNPGVLTRMSQHALLSSQTLGQLFEAIPCSSKETPQEIVQDGTVVGYVSNDTATNSGCVICIEGCAYGDGYGDDDYAWCVCWRMFNNLVMNISIAGSWNSSRRKKRLVLKKRRDLCGKPHSKLSR